jgi:hypothetical protein
LVDDPRENGTKLKFIFGMFKRFISPAALFFGCRVFHHFLHGLVKKPLHPAEPLRSSLLQRAVYNGFTFCWLSSMVASKGMMAILYPLCPFWKTVVSSDIDASFYVSSDIYQPATIQ